MALAENFPTAPRVTFGIGLFVVLIAGFSLAFMKLVGNSELWNRGGR